MNIYIRIVTAVLLIWSAAMQTKGQTLVEIGEIDLRPEVLLQKFESTNIQFKTAKRKTVGNYQCFFINEILKDQLSNIQEKDYPKIILLIESADGSEQAATIGDFNEKTTALMPVLVFENTLGTVGDTVDIEEIDGKLNFAKIDKEVKKRVQQRLHLQISTISNTIKKRYFRNGSIIFPMDISNNRWITDAVKIKIYKLEN